MTRKRKSLSKRRSESLSWNITGPTFVTYQQIKEISKWKGRKTSGQKRDIKQFPLFFSFFLIYAHTHSNNTYKYFLVELHKDQSCTRISNMNAVNQLLKINLYVMEKQETDIDQYTNWTWKTITCISLSISYVVL